MADNFNENQIELISSNKIIYDFDETMGDYVQVIVTNQDGEIVRLNDNSLAIFSSPTNLTIYKDNAKDTDGNAFPNIFVKPNEILSQYNIPTGNYV